MNRRLPTLLLWATLLAVSLPAFFARKARTEDVVLDRRRPAVRRLEAWKKLDAEKGRELGRKLIGDPSEDVELRRALEALLTSSPPAPAR